MPVLEHSGIAQHYEISGTGPPLLMVAGMISDSASWAPMIPLLESHFTLIRPDNRTTGRTTPLDAPATVALFAADCAALLDALDLGPAHVLGHSLGGMIGMQLAIAQPRLVRTLTLAASAPLALKRNVAMFRNLLAIRHSDASADTWWNALFLWLFSPDIYQTSNAARYAVAGALTYRHAQTAQAMALQVDALEAYQPATIEQVHIPVQAVLGTGDILLPSALAVPALGQTPIHHIDGAGHSIHWDAPDVLAKHLREFTALHEAPKDR